MTKMILTFAVLAAFNAQAGNDTTPGLPVCPENCGVTFNKKAPVAPKNETQKAPHRLGR